MPTSYPQNIPTIIHAMQEVNPKTVLDIGVGHGKYGLLVREYCNPDRVDGVEGTGLYINPIVLSLYNTLYAQDIRKIDLDTLPDYDLVLLIDVIEHLSKEDGHKLLQHFTLHGSHVLVSTPIEDYREPYPDTPLENHVSHWALVDFSDYQVENFTNALATIVLIKPLTV